MAHELSQPLNVIRMAAQNALTETAPAAGSADGDGADDTADDDFPLLSDAEFRTFAAGKLTRIMAQVDRAADILSRMRIFGRAPSGPAKIFDARQAVRSALDLVGPRIRGSGITIREQLGQDELPLSGQQNLLEQVMVNLLMNARDALASKHQLDRVIEVSAALGPNGHVLLRVADNGPGVPAEIRERVFEPFFTAKPLGQGTGLGLALSFGIVREAGGTLSLLPESGRGATFQVDLPSAPSPVKAAAD
jgi:signal transduction histidine kinase